MIIDDLFAVGSGFLSLFFFTFFFFRRKHSFANVSRTTARFTFTFT